MSSTCLWLPGLESKHPAGKCRRSSKTLEPKPSWVSYDERQMLVDEGHPAPGAEQERETGSGRNLHCKEAEAPKT